jgi:hypothetical protein
MGDRTYLKMEVASIDMHKFEEIIGEGNDGVFNYFNMYQDQDSDVITELFEEEANYGYFELREKWAREGLVFRGSHYEGGDYGAQLFCGIDGKHYAVEASHGLDHPVCRIDPETMKPLQEDLSCILKYLNAMSRIKEYFHKCEKEMEQAQKGESRGTENVSC